MNKRLCARSASATAVLLAAGTASPRSCSWKPRHRHEDAGEQPARSRGDAVPAARTPVAEAELARDRLFKTFVQKVCSKTGNLRSKQKIYIKAISLTKLAESQHERNKHSQRLQDSMAPRWHRKTQRPPPNPQPKLACQWSGYKVVAK